MKSVLTLTLMLAMGWSIGHSQPITVKDIEPSSLEVQEYLDNLMDDDYDFEIVDLDDALHKARILRALSRLIAEAEAMDVGHPRKRFIGSVFRKLKKVISKAARKIGDYFKKTWNNAKEAFNKVAHGDFNAAVQKVIPYIHSGMTVAGCKAAVTTFAATVLGPAAPVAGIVAGPLCSAALAKLEEAAG